jgi:hypothetical protein
MPNTHEEENKSFIESPHRAQEVDCDEIEGPKIDPHQEFGLTEGNDAMESVFDTQTTDTAKWVKSTLMVLCPIACFWGLNLASAANTKIQAVTFRMYIMKLVTLLLEISALQVSATKLNGVGRRLKLALFSTIFGLVAAVLTTISQIDGRADGECVWETVLQSAYSNLQNCRVSETVSGSSDNVNWQTVTRSSWCCEMVRDGDYLSRTTILSSAAMASAAALWGWLAAVLTGSAAITFGGSGYLAATSAFLLGWGSRGDDHGEWLLFAIVWLATLATPISMLLSPLPFLYDGVAVTGGMISSTSHVRRALVWTAVLTEAVILPTVGGGAITAMGVAMVVRVVLSLAVAAVSAAAAARYFGARAQRASLSPALREVAAAAAARSGLVTEDGRIAAADVFEFDPDGPRARWQWILKDGKQQGRLAVRPFEEYRRLGSATATAGAGTGAASPDNEGRPRRCCGRGAWSFWARLLRRRGAAPPAPPPPDRAAGHV